MTVESGTGLAERLARRVRGLERQCYFPLDRDASRAALLLGSGRSGTTWLGEVIAGQCRSRLMFEPFHPLWNRHEDTRLFMAPEATHQFLEAAVNRVLSGRLRKRQVDQVLIRCFPRGRVVKDIHTTNLVGWFRHHHPDVPVAYVVRHPIATSYSRLRGGEWFGIATYLESPAGREDIEDSPAAAWLPPYDEFAGHAEPLVRLVAEWCIENAYPLELAGSDDGIAVTFYENAVVDPQLHVGRLIDLCAPALVRGPAPRPALAELRKPSAKDSFGTAAAAVHEADWSRALDRWRNQLPAGLIADCLGVLEAFGLGGLYGEHPMPRNIGTQPNEIR